MTDTHGSSIPIDDIDDLADAVGVLSHTTSSDEWLDWRDWVAVLGVFSLPVTLSWGWVMVC